MSAIILTLAASIIFGCLIWLLLGPRIKLNVDDLQNEVLNVFVYIVGSFVVFFPIVFFIFGG